MLACLNQHCSACIAQPHIKPHCSACPLRRAAAHATSTPSKGCILHKRTLHQLVWCGASVQRSRPTWLNFGSSMQPRNVQSAAPRVLNPSLLPALLVKPCPCWAIRSAAVLTHESEQLVTPSCDACQHRMTPLSCKQLPWLCAAPTLCQLLRCYAHKLRPLLTHAWGGCLAGSLGMASAAACQLLLLLLCLLKLSSVGRRGGACDNLFQACLRPAAAAATHARGRSLQMCPSPAVVCSNEELHP
jgi:hypothetical protein